MNEALKKFSADILKDFKAALIKNQPDIAHLKGAQDGVPFKVIISTSDEDRQGDSLDQSKWKLENYKNNPVVLWAHDYYNPPIGICTGISVENGKLVAEGRFAPAELNEFAGQIAGLYEAGYINTTSVGYIQHEDGELELLEFSFVPVPANPYALSLRDMKRLNLNTAELVMKGLRFVTKAPQIGEECELEDGSPGVLAEDEDNPGRLVCVPAEDEKSKKTNRTMDNELTKKLKAEHGRHATEIAKHIDEFEEKCVKGVKGEKAAGPDEYEKALDEFREKIDGEHEEHLEKCMKAIDDSYETMGREPNKDEKAIDEFKAEMKSEHLKHVKAFDKAMDGLEEVEHPGDGEDMKPVKDGIQEFTEKAKAELERHEKAHMDMCKAEAERMGEGETEEKSGKKGAVADEMREDEMLQEKYQRIDKAYSVFYAFVSAYLDESAAVDDYEKLLDEAVALMKNTEAKAKLLAKHLKAGRQISAKNKEKIKAIIKMIKDGHTEHGKAVEEVTAALKELMGSEESGDGKEPQDGKSAAQNSRSRPSGDGNQHAKALSDFDAYMLTRDILRAVNKATVGGLEQMNKVFKSRYRDRR